jgi:hypothetical protein
MKKRLLSWLEAFADMRLGPKAWAWCDRATRLLSDLENEESSDPLHDDDPQTRFDGIVSDHAQLFVK